MRLRIDSHPNQLYASEMAELCRSLEKLKISYFAKVRVDKEGRFSFLNNNPEFTQYYFNNKYYNADIHMAKTVDLGKYVLWDDLKLNGSSEKLFREAREFGVDHTFTIIETNNDAKNYYHFSSNLLGKSINQEYLQQLDLLHLFIQYFNQQLTESSHLNQAFSTNFSLTADSADFVMRNSRARESFLQQIKVASYQSILTKREIDCLLLTLQGKTAKLIAKELGISHRTVEEHLATIKYKMNARSKSELFEKALAQ